MPTYAIIASGPSLTDEDVEHIRKARECGIIYGVIAVSNVGLDKAPWADYLISYDSAWWRGYPESQDFKGKKICSQDLRGVEVYKPPFMGCNSGLMGICYAEKIGADKIILLGFDMHGTHYFGKHERKNGNIPLKNSNDSIFKRHKEQFRRWRGCEVINCTPGTSLTCFKIQSLYDTI